MASNLLPPSRNNASRCGLAWLGISWERDQPLIVRDGLVIFPHNQLHCFRKLQYSSKKKKKSVLSLSLLISGWPRRRRWERCVRLPSMWGYHVAPHLTQAMEPWSKESKEGRKGGGHDEKNRQNPQNAPVTRSKISTPVASLALKVPWQQQQSQRGEERDSRLSEALFFNKRFRSTSWFTSKRLLLNMKHVVPVVRLRCFCATDGNIHNLSSDISFPYGCREPRM